MSADNSQLLDQARIRDLMADQAGAICARDINRIMSHYASDVVFFDCKPPFQTKGADAFRRIWESCLPFFPDSFGIQTRDLNVFVSGDLALSHSLFRFTGMEKDHPAMQTWLRSTVGYRRDGGKWRIIHEHCSVPFDPHSARAFFTLEP